MLRRLRQKTDSWEDAFSRLLYRLRVPLFLLVVTALALYARSYFYPVISGDFSVHLDHWLNDIRANQGLRSIGMQIGNYTKPYHYMLALFTYIPGLDNLAIIKITSIAGDFLMAAGGAALAWQLTRSVWKGTLAYAILLCLPTVFLNSAAWGQCDAYYTAFVLWALFFWFKGQKAVAMLVYGVALAVKLQAIFILPAFVIFWLCGRLRLRQLLCAVGGYVVCFVPAIIASGSFACLTEAYGMQTKVHSLSAIIHNGLTVFDGLTQEQVYQLSDGLVIFALLAVGIVAFYCWQMRARFTRDSELIVCLLMICLVVYLMPGMRERYFYAAECLAVVYALRWPRRLFLPLVLQLGVLPTYIFYLFGGELLMGWWLVIITALPALVCFWDLYRHLAATPPQPAGSGQITQ